MRYHKIIFIVIFITAIFSCNNDIDAPKSKEDDLAASVKSETLRAWNGYKQYAWGKDEFNPLSKSGSNWYSEPLYISPIDAYSTLKVMGLDNEAKEVEEFVETLSFDKDVSVSVFETTIRIVGGLLSMYQYTGNEKILALVKDFGDRLLPAYESETGIPYSSVNLKTGEVSGDVPGIAGTAFTMEMGILSYYTKDPIYYQKAKKAMMAVFERRSEIGLVGDYINIHTGAWEGPTTHICAGVDSYYEYIYKTWLLFKDPDIKAIWDGTIPGLLTYLPEQKDGLTWYKRVDMNTGVKTSSQTTLWDAFFPATLALSGHVTEGEDFQRTWDWLWNMQGLEPSGYDYSSGTITDYGYDLNPEIIESAYYLYHFTKTDTYKDMAKKYFENIQTYCKTDVAFTRVDNIVTKRKGDSLATFFFAETMKYLYLIFSEGNGEFDFEDHIFTTEAHTFKRSSFDQTIINDVLLQQ